MRWAPAFGVWNSVPADISMTQDDESGQNDRPATDQDVLSRAWAARGLPGGVYAFTTTTGMGSFGLAGSEPVAVVMDRWDGLMAALARRGVQGLASSAQVHGAQLAEYSLPWLGWLRRRGVDGHVSTVPGSALAVTVADCVPILIGHPGGAIAALHAGWRGSAANILEAGLDLLERKGFPAAECQVYLGPAICGSCYEVGPEVISAVTGRGASGKQLLDMRQVLAERAVSRGVAGITVESACTRCGPRDFFSHRAGDSGRQLAVIALPFSADASSQSS